MLLFQISFSHNHLLQQPSLSFDSLTTHSLLTYIHNVHIVYRVKCPWQSTSSFVPTKVMLSAKLRVLHAKSSTRPRGLGAIKLTLKKLEA